MTVVLDSSAVLATVLAEPGGAAVEPLLEESVISAVNWAEVVQRAQQIGVDTSALRDDMAVLGLQVVAFDAAAAAATAALSPLTRSTGLSLADRACLALASAMACPAVTADRAWRDIAVGIEVQLIR